MEKLAKEFKEKWIAALRSGEYKQGRLQLRTDEGYCCLGVACKIAGISDDKMGDFCYPSLLAEENPDDLPIFFRHSTRDTPVWNLAIMNDRDLKSFSEIADYIEQNL